MRGATTVRAVGDRRPSSVELGKELADVVGEVIGLVHGDEMVAGWVVLRPVGTPVVAGTPVLGQLAAGQTVEQVLEAYPYLELEDILAALSFATEAMQERELPLAQPA
jgi:uncharacterized protein (DUF433 family)